MTVLDMLFVLTAIGGGALFALRLLLLLMAGEMDADVDVDVDVDVDLADGADHAEADSGVKALSLQSVAAFFMLFGLVGWAMRRDSHAGAVLSLVAALVAGLASIWLMSGIFRFFKRMQSSGTLDTSKAVGAVGTVYLGITRDKPGKASIVVANRLLTLDAISDEPEPLPTGTPVRVVKVIDGSSVVVRRS